MCTAEQLPEITREFEHDAAGMHERVVYFGAEKRLEDRFIDSSNHSMALLGAQPAWEPSSWLKTADSHSSLRAQFNRAVNKGVLIEEWPPEQASNSSELRAVLDRWLSGRSLPPLHFLVEPSTLERLDDRRVFIARQRHSSAAAANRIVAFAVLSPVPARRGWLIEQFPRIPDAPNGIIELLMREAVRTVAAEGATYLTLGLAPLAQRDVIVHPPEPKWLRALLGIMRVHVGGFTISRV